MKNHLKYLLLAGALLALTSCYEEHEQNRKANVAATKTCNDAGGIARFDAGGWIATCDFTIRDQIRNRPALPAEAPKIGDTQ